MESSTSDVSEATLTLLIGIARSGFYAKHSACDLLGDNHERIGWLDLEMVIREVGLPGAHTPTHVFLCSYSIRLIIDGQRTARSSDKTPANRSRASASHRSSSIPKLEMTIVPHARTLSSRLTHSFGDNVLSILSTMLFFIHHLQWINWHCELQISQASPVIRSTLPNFVELDRKLAFNLEINWKSSNSKRTLFVRTYRRSIVMNKNKNN